MKKIQDDFDLSLADKKAHSEYLDYKFDMFNNRRAYSEGFMGDLIEHLLELMKEMFSNISLFKDKDEEREGNINKSKQKAENVVKYIENMVKNDSDNMTTVKMDKNETTKKAKLDKELLDVVNFLKSTGDNDVDGIIHNLLNNGYDSKAVKNSFMMYAMHYGYQANFIVFKTYGNDKDESVDHDLQKSLDLLGAITSMVELLGALSIIVIYMESKNTNITEKDNAKNTNVNQNTTINKASAQSLNILADIYRAGELLSSMLAYSEDSVLDRNSEFVNSYKQAHDVLNDIFANNNIDNNKLLSRISDIDSAKNSALNNLSGIHNELKKDTVKTIKTEDLRALETNARNIENIITNYRGKLEIIQTTVSNFINNARQANGRAVNVRKDQNVNRENDTIRRENNTAEMNDLFNVMLKQNNIISELAVRIGNVLSMSGNYLSKLNATLKNSRNGANIQNVNGVQKNRTNEEVANDNKQVKDNFNNQNKEQQAQNLKDIHQNKSDKSVNQGNHNTEAVAKQRAANKNNNQNNNANMENMILSLFGMSGYGENDSNNNNNNSGNNGGNNNGGGNTPNNNNNQNKNINPNITVNNNTENNGNTAKNNINTPTTNQTNNLNVNTDNTNRIVNVYSGIINHLKNIVKQLVVIPDENNRRLVEMNKIPTLAELEQGKGVLNTSSTTNNAEVITLSPERARELSQMIRDAELTPSDIGGVLSANALYFNADITKEIMSDKSLNNISKGMNAYMKKLNTHIKGLDDEGKRTLRRDVLNGINSTTMKQTIKDRITKSLDKILPEIPENSENNNNNQQNNTNQNNNQGGNQ